MSDVIEESTLKTALQLLAPRLRPRYADLATDIMEPSAVIAVPFNRYLRRERPDETNRMIANIAISYCLSLDLPFFGQWEQSSLLQGNENIRVFPFPSEDGEWVQTHRLLAWISERLSEQKLSKEVILVGHPHHVRRVAILAEHYGLMPHVAPECAVVPYDPSNRPGAQWWCKSTFRYVLWEFLLARPKLILDDLRGAL